MGCSNSSAHPACAVARIRDPETTNAKLCLGQFMTSLLRDEPAHRMRDASCSAAAELLRIPDGLPGQVPVCLRVVVWLQRSPDVDIQSVQLEQPARLLVVSA